MKNIILLSTLVIVWCSNYKNIIDFSNELKASQENEIFVVSHGWHTGFVIPREVIKREIPVIANRFKKTQYLEFGWGDKGFYQSKKFSLSLAVSAILWPTDSVMHIVAVPKTAEDFFPNSEVQKICLNANQVSSLVLFISKSFFRDKYGNLEKLQKGLYGNSQFYKGVDDFHAMNTCNKWTAKGLKSVGIEISTTYKLTASSVMDYLTEVEKKKNFRSYFDCSVK